MHIFMYVFAAVCEYTHLSFSFKQCNHSNIRHNSRGIWEGNHGFGSSGQMSTYFFICCAQRTIQLKNAAEVKVQLASCFTNNCHLHFKIFWKKSF